MTEKTKSENLIQFLVFVTAFALGVASLIAMWNIDISVGAMNSGGCVYQDTKCIPALQFYETSLSILVFCVLMLTIISLVVIAF